MLRRYFSSNAHLAHEFVKQQVQGRLSLLTSYKSIELPFTQIMLMKQKEKSLDTKSEMTNFSIDISELSDLPFQVSTPQLMEFKAKAKEVMYLYPSTIDNLASEKQRLILVGLGESTKINENILRDATDQALKIAKNKGSKDVILHVPNLENIKMKKERIIEVLSQAAMLSNYQFDKYLTKKDENGGSDMKLPLENIVINVSEEFQDIVKEQEIVAEETIFARNLGNERANIVNPSFMEEVAKSSSNLPNMSVRVLQKDDLEKEGMNLFLSVGQGADQSTSAPRLVILEYKGDPSSQNKVALVGKGITFDTGGLNLKPTGYIEDMHTDMCGSAAVLGAIRAAARAGLKVNLVCALALAENAIGSKSVKPHTILKSHKGITVENNNTDAEGRLVLCDALSYIQQEYKPKVVVDVATLTGACMVALGDHCAGLFSNSDELAEEILQAGKSSYERCWRLPIDPEHTAALKGSQADSRSTGKGRFGGASTAAAFLQQFIDKDVKWAHVDIAGPSNYSAPKSYFPKGATGFGVQLLYTYLKQNTEKNSL